MSIAEKGNTSAVAIILAQHLLTNVMYTCPGEENSSRQKYRSREANKFLLFYKIKIPYLQPFDFLSFGLKWK